MSIKLFRRSKKCFSLFLSGVLLFGLIGCSPSSDQPVDNLTDIESPSDAEGAVLNADTDTRISDNGQPIYDFDEFANREWYESINADTESVTYLSNSYLNYIYLVKDILESTDLSSLSEDDALYKTVSLYNELTDRSDPDGRLESIRAYLEPINNVKTLNDLYDLYSVPEYAISNYLIDINVKPDFYWDNIGYVSPKSKRDLFDLLKESLDKNCGDMTLRLYLNELGYDDSIIEELFKNAYEIEDKIDELFDSDEWINDEYFYYYNEEGAIEDGLTVPVFDIVESLNGYGTHGYILCKTCIFDLYNELYVPENIDKLRDYYVLSSLWIVYYSGYEFLDVTQSGMQLTGDDIAVIYIMNNAPDVISKEVMKRCCSDSDSKEINSLLLQIKTSAIKVIEGIDWLSDDAKNLAQVKISRLTQYIGQNGHNYNLNGYVMNGDPIIDLIGLAAESYRFEMIQTYFSDIDRAPFGSSVNTCTAYYYRQYNCLLISAGMISDSFVTGAESFEEKLGYFGAIAAHEIGHSSDSLGILYNETGYYDPIITDDDYDAYMEKLDSIKAFFDGKTVYDGYSISGDIICDETYADLFAVRTCLNILAEKEDADYDLFFRTYAMYNAGLYGESNIADYSEDGHLMAKARINYVLGQFDEFYDTYNIDESSPYYVPESERLRIF